MLLQNLSMLIGYLEAFFYSCNCIALLQLHNNIPQISLYNKYLYCTLTSTNNIRTALHAVFCHFWDSLLDWGINSNKVSVYIDEISDYARCCCICIIFWFYRRLELAIETQYVYFFCKSFGSFFNNFDILITCFSFFYFESEYLL